MSYLNLILEDFLSSEYTSYQIETMPFSMKEKYMKEALNQYKKDVIEPLIDNFDEIEKLSSKLYNIPSLQEESSEISYEFFKQAFYEDIILKIDFYQDDYIKFLDNLDENEIFIDYLTFIVQNYIKNKYLTGDIIQDSIEQDILDNSLNLVPKVSKVYFDNVKKYVKNILEKVILN